MFPTVAPCFIIGGRFGDIAQMLPCFREIFRRSGKKPHVVSSAEYASIYQGVSYVEPHAINAHWWQGMPAFKQVAHHLCGNGIVVQFWQEPPKHDDTIGFGGRNWTTLQCHGHEHGVNMAFDPDYGTSMARRCGFSRAEWVKLPLVFDRRDYGREAAFAKSVFGPNPKPVLLYNFTGNSSPFHFAPEVTNLLLRRFAQRFKLVDLGHVRAYRVYDLIGLMDRAVGMLTSDTLTWHLAPASNKPWIGFHVDGWTQSVPKKGNQLSIGYNETPRRLSDVARVLESWR